MILIWSLLIPSVSAEEYIVEGAVVKNNIKAIFKEIHANTNRYQDWQELFPGWSEKDVVNFIECLRLINSDYEVTKLGIDKYGFPYEMNPIYRAYFENGIGPNELFLPVSIGLYFLLKDMEPTERRIFLFILAGVEYWAIGTHRPYGFFPTQKVPTFTILKIRF